MVLIPTHEWSCDWPRVPDGRDSQGQQERAAPSEPAPGINGRGTPGGDDGAKPARTCLARSVVVPRGRDAPGRPDRHGYRVESGGRARTRVRRLSRLSAPRVDAPRPFRPAPRRAKVGGAQFADRDPRYTHADATDLRAAVESYSAESAGPRSHETAPAVCTPFAQTGDATGHRLASADNQRVVMEQEVESCKRLETNQFVIEGQPFAPSDTSALDRVRIRFYNYHQ